MYQSEVIQFHVLEMRFFPDYTLFTLNNYIRTNDLCVLNFNYFMHFKDCQAGLNFANEDEANKFKAVVNDKINQRAKRRIGKSLFTLSLLYIGISWDLQVK